MQVAVGTGNGLVALFDLRSSRPLLVKDHMYGERIRDIKWHVSGGEGGALGVRRVVSADSHVVKVRWGVVRGVGYFFVCGGEVGGVGGWPGVWSVKAGCSAASKLVKTTPPRAPLADPTHQPPSRRSGTPPAATGSPASSPRRGTSTTCLSGPPPG